MIPTMGTINAFSCQARIAGRRGLLVFLLLGAGCGSANTAAQVRTPRPDKPPPASTVENGAREDEEKQKIALEAWRPGTALTQAVGRVTDAARKFEQQSDFGFDEDASCVLGARLDGPKSVSITRPMRRGVRYMILGGGSEGIENLDIVVENLDGKRIAWDTLADATPVVDVRAPRDGDVRIRMTNRKSGPSGGVGVVAIMREGGYSIKVADLVSSFGHAIANAAKASRFVAARGAAHGLVLHADGEWGFFGTILAPEKGIGTGGLDLRAPLSVVLAGADGRSEDVDLEVTDTTTGAAAGKDEGEDAEPVVVLQPERGHTYKVSVANRKSPGPSLVTMVVLDAAPE
jgi:hypothetical protein